MLLNADQSERELLRNEWLTSLKSSLYLFDVFIIIICYTFLSYQMMY